MSKREKSPISVKIIAPIRKLRPEIVRNAKEILFMIFLIYSSDLAGTLEPMEASFRISMTLSRL